jgi:hypothetical protein
MKFSLIFFLLAGLITSAYGQTNSIGKRWPDDAAPADQQVFRYTMLEPLSYDISIALYEAQGAVPLFERLTMLNKDLELVPAAASSWESSSSSG